MFHITTCPTCQTRFSIPEGNVGTRQICPHCQSPFVAGKSVAEEPGPMKADAASAYTMLGEQGASGLIKYNCPRCKKPLEAPASEAGTKKPCPACGQRVQVPQPAPAAAAAADPALNKTLLGEDQGKEQPMIRYNCPNCKKPLESPATEAGMKKPCPHCSQRMQIPSASSASASNPLNKTLLAEETGITSSQPAAAPALAASAPAPAAAPELILGFRKRTVQIAGGVAAALLLVGIGIALTAPGAAAAREQYERQQRDLEEMKNQIAQFQKLVELSQQQLSQKNTEMENVRKQADQQRQAEMQRYLELQKSLQDEKKAAEAKEKHEAELRRIAQAKDDNDRRLQQQADQHKAQMDAIQAQLKQQTEKQTTIIQQHAPPPYYHRWHPYWGWGW